MANCRHNPMPYAPCRPLPPEPQPVPLAMAYVPWQMWRDIYDAEKGFCCGTIFQELKQLPSVANSKSNKIINTQVKTGALLQKLYFSDEYLPNEKALHPLYFMISGNQ